MLNVDDPRVGEFGGEVDIQPGKPACVVAAVEEQEHNRAAVAVRTSDVAVVVEKAAADLADDVLPGRVLTDPGRLAELEVVGVGEVAPVRVFADLGVVLVLDNGVVAGLDELPGVDASVAGVGGCDTSRVEAGHPDLGDAVLTGSTVGPEIVIGLVPTVCLEVHTHEDRVFVGPSRQVWGWSQRGKVYCRGCPVWYFLDLLRVVGHGERWCLLEIINTVQTENAMVSAVSSEGIVGLTILCCVVRLFMAAMEICV